MGISLSIEFVFSANQSVASGSVLRIRERLHRSSVQRSSPAW